MMWSSIANLKENLNKIALDVHDDDDEEEALEIYNSRDLRDSSVSDRRISHSSASHSPVANGFDSPYISEIEQYKTEIKRLRESEAEIKALSVNYAALLKEKEDRIFRLNEENGLLKQNLDATSAAMKASKNESFKTSANSLNVVKGSSDQSLNRQQKALTKNRSITNQMHNGIVSKQDGLSNGAAHSMQFDEFQSNREGGEKELADLLEEKNRSLAVIQASHELQVKQLGMELEKERTKLANVQLKLREEQKLNGSFQEKLNSLKVDNNKISMEMNKVHDELNKKISEVGRLQMELKHKEDTKIDDVVDDLKRVIATIERENSSLKMEKEELEAALKVATNSSAQKQSSSLDESLGSFPGKEEMELSLRKLEKDLKETRRERDKALQELNRLKQHLLDKESEEAEKMDEDSKIIEELRENNEYLKAQILFLEKSLKQAMASQEEVKIINNNELQKSREIISDLNKRLASCTNTINAKDVELLNLQTALGQYYAEMEAKERLDGDLSLAREESIKLVELLKDANQKAEISNREKEEVLEKLSQAERMVAEGKNRANKLEEANVKLRNALELSMTRLNRMSLDSDYFVDRRIVIKLLVTYFQRNHSKEVLDLMVRVLGFSDEDKQRIGVAQQGGGKGVVRGVLGLPGRLVGGILGGSSAGSPSIGASDDQSFADQWVDFLLKETEEKERRESAEASSGSNGSQHGTSPDPGTASSLHNPRTNAANSATGFSRLNPQNQNQPLSYGNIQQPEQSFSEFSTLPLNSSESSSRLSRLLPKY
ncbi:golgin candidate 4 isoform X2 [Cornus florida]|uniref:golgin candidate 4 isoform X2 n=1 Tax=Cornus florida TaxID=4283 RepID=UPI00289F4969|nr:golgin candidate 4 isoform X2 [Cornus florida]